MGISRKDLEKIFKYEQAFTSAYNDSVFAMAKVKYPWLFYLNMPKLTLLNKIREKLPWFDPFKNARQGIKFLEKNLNMDFLSEKDLNFMQLTDYNKSVIDWIEPFISGN
jgi:hypothetical protein